MENSFGLNISPKCIGLDMNLSRFCFLLMLLFMCHTLNAQVINVDTMTTDGWRRTETNWAPIPTIDKSFKMEASVSMNRYKSEKFEFIYLTLFFKSTIPEVLRRNVKIVFKDSKDKYNELYASLSPKRIDSMSDTFSAFISIRVNKESKKILLNNNIVKMKVFTQEPFIIEFESYSFSKFVTKALKLIEEKQKNKLSKPQKYNF